MLSWNIHLTSQECQDRLSEVFETMHQMIENGEAAELQKRFNLCHPVNASSAKDVAMFFEGQIQFVSDFIDNNQ